jgi:hypothetical protein
MVINNEGIPLKTTLDNSTTVQVNENSIGNSTAVEVPLETTLDNTTTIQVPLTTALEILQQFRYYSNPHWTN